MKLNVVLLASLCIVGALGAKEKVTKLDKSEDALKPKRETPNEPKPKREAPISGGSSYHGPSYKYLPPSASATAGGYDSYSSGHHAAAGGVGGYSLGGSGFGGGHSLEGGHYGSSTPKVETYIVQTETAHGGGHGYADSHGSHGFSGSQGFSGSHGFGSSHGVSSSHGGAGYRYASPSASFSGGFGSHQSGFGSHQSGFGSSYSQSHGPVHKIKAIVIPTNSFSAIGHGGGGQTRFGGNVGGYSYSKGLSGIGGSSYQSSGIGGGAYSAHHSPSSGSYNIGHAAGAGFSSVQGSHSYEQGYDIPTQSLEATYRDSDHNDGQGGYSYEAPTSSYAHGQGHGIPSNSYGAPNSILSPPYQSGEAGYQSPSYAVGHKGLGHFGYSASKPQVLHTNFIDSNSYNSDSYASQGHSSHENSHSYSKAPFKPSLFLGASHDSSSSAGGSISSEYGAPAAGHGISTQYLPPPTSEGYDYPSPSALYGAPIDSHSHGIASGSVHEPETAYLPPAAPQTSYGPPATPGDTYLPPHHH